MQFLKYVSDDLRKKFGNDLSRVAVVFPNKRAGIFFDDYLLDSQEESTIWAPSYMTISDLFDSLSTLSPVDDIRAVCLLYHIYKEELEKNETEKASDITLDFFYGWGAQLLSDFSDIDRSMANAHDVFDTWGAARQLETMTEEQRQQLQPIVELFKGTGSLKEDFEHLWVRLYDIYKSLNAALEKDGEAYEGARQRQVIENLGKGSQTLSEQFDKYVFVGFNMLLPVEWKLFEYIQSEGKALFYWDYDRIYVGKDAIFSFGKSMEHNISHFPNELPDTIFDNLADRPTLEFVASASDNAQAHYASAWLEQNLTHEDEKRTAIVLCDETLLQPIIHCLPEEVKEVNITKGFPMSHTPAYAFVIAAFESTDTDTQQEDTPNLSLLNHLSADLQQKALEEMKSHGEQTWLGQLTAESYFQCFTTVNRFRTFVSDGTLNVSRRTLQGLLRQVLSQLSIPFHGEPATGLQIMGMLETRNLDFDQLLILSVGEGIVPKKVADRSFIPYDLRKYYHIMTGDERSEVYAYNFFRLLQRSRHVTLVYNESTDGQKRCGEMSRFMVQILAETDIPVNCYSLSERNTIPEQEVKGINADEVKLLMEKRQLNLSVSALEKYLDCPMKYFFSNILKIKDLPQATDILPANTFGSIFHRAAERIYEDFRKGRPEVVLHPDELRALSENIVKLEQYITEAFNFVSQEDGQTYDKNEHEVEADVIRKYLENLLKCDARIAETDGLTFVHAEKNLQAKIDDNTSLNGKIDRLDMTRIDGRNQKRIIDYKTGRYNEKKMTASSFEELFSNNEKNYVLQTMYYELLYRLVHQETPVAAIYYTQKLAGTELHPYVKFGNKKDGTDSLAPEKKLDIFKKHLMEKIQKIRSSDYTFTRNEKACKYCKFSLLCGYKA